jgi:hypothetical protein
MLSGAKSLSATRFAIQLVALFAGGAAAGAATTPSESAGYKSTPQLNVRVYSFAGLAPGLVQAAEMEATRLLRDVPLNLDWVDCTSRAASTACMTDPLPTDLVVRVLAKALPQASASALGIAGTNGGEAAAFIFYDRMVSLRTQARSLPSIVGRVLAHEITHLLLPRESHSELGLMRGHWTADDMRTVSSACTGVSAASGKLMQNEALRRVISARELASK